jgi:hypothetical protein
MPPGGIVSAMRHVTRRWLSRRQLARLAMWGGVTSSAMLLAAWITSIHLWVQVNFLAIFWFGICVEQGNLIVGWFTSESPQWVLPFSHMQWHYAELRGSTIWSWFPRFYSGLNDAAFHCPLWIPLLLSIGVTCLLWRRTRMLRDPGICPFCGYSLRGLPAASIGSPRCPECGGERAMSQGGTS